jgi:hypothetical protein
MVKDTQVIWEMVEIGLILKIVILNEWNEEVGKYIIGFHLGYKITHD